MFCTILIAIANYSIAMVKENFYIAIISIMLIWIMNLCWGMSNLKKRYIFLGMNLMIFVFILSRPIISTFRMEQWWYFSIEAVWKSLNAILISLLAILAGGIIAEKIKFKNENEEIKHNGSSPSRHCIGKQLWKQQERPTNQCVGRRMEYHHRKRKRGYGR